MDRIYIATTRQVEVSGSDTPTIVGIGTLAIAVISFLGAWAFNTIASGWKEDMSDLRTQIGKLETNHAVSSELFVRREDYLRAMDSIDKKLDNMATRQEGIMQRQDQQFQVLLNRLAPLARHHEQN